MKKFVPKASHDKSHILIILGIDVILASVIFIGLMVIGISKNISLLISFFIVV